MGYDLILKKGESKNMEHIKKVRTPQRRAFRRFANLFETSLKVKNKYVEKIEILYTHLRKK